jgi:hypothetical protein
LLRAQLSHLERCRNPPHQRKPAAMSDTSISTSSLPSNLASNQSKTHNITRKVRDAITHMVWAGLPRDQAAEKAGLSDHGLYKALRSPPVKQHYLAELDVLRTSERARNIHRAVEIREQSTNQMASIQAIKLLEQISDDAPSGRNAQSLPGMVIVINNGSATKEAVTIDSRPILSSAATGSESK